MVCKFCEWKKHYKPIYENEHFIAAWGSPYIKGHVKVILKRHEESLTNLSPEESSSLMDAWIKVGQAIEKALKPDIINWQINCNWTRHIHGHIYPRWKTDNDWGEPMILPTRNQVKEGNYEHKELSDDEKRKILEALG